MYLPKEKLKQFDERILLSIQRWRCPPLNYFFLLLTYSATGYAWFSYVLVFNILHLANIHFVTEQTHFLRAFLYPFLAWIISSIIKKLIARERPVHTIDGLHSLLPSPSCKSFPSAHASTTIALATALIFHNHPLAIIVGLWAILVSISRCYLGLHFLTDIIGGALIGFLLTSVFWLIFRI